MLDTKALIAKVLNYLLPENRETLTSNIHYQKKAGIVFVDIYGSYSLSGSWTTAGTLPAGYRPATIYYFAATTVTDNSNIIGYVNSAGTIGLRLVSGSGSKSVEAVISFIAA